ncbi:hypothetical protein BJ742DRAFT_822968 [Cladochytrium replicatum]|nr:hypothetical protein BJ742DRAFT_822968 [Cladochytrium replicatum]
MLSPAALLPAWPWPSPSLSSPKVKVSSPSLKSKLLFGPLSPSIVAKKQQVSSPLVSLPSLPSSTPAINVARSVASWALSTASATADLLAIPQLADKLIDENFKASSARVIAAATGISLHALGDLIDVVASKAHEYDLVPTVSESAPPSPTDSAASTAVDPGEFGPDRIRRAQTQYLSTIHPVHPVNPKPTYTGYIHNHLKLGISLLSRTGILNKYVYRDQAANLVSLFVPSTTESTPKGITPVSPETLSTLNYSHFSGFEDSEYYSSPRFYFCAAAEDPISTLSVRKDLNAARAIKAFFKDAVVRQSSYGGTGYASIVAAAMCLDIDLRRVEELFNEFDRDCEKRFLGAISSSKSGIRQLLWTLLRDVSDSEVREKTFERLYISLSKCRLGRGFHGGAWTHEMRTSFKSKAVSLKSQLQMKISEQNFFQDLIDVALAATYVPIYHESMTLLPDAKDAVYMCGAFTENTLAANDVMGVFVNADGEKDVREWVSEGMKNGILSVGLLRDYTKFI